MIFEGHLPVIVQYCLDLRKPDLRKNLELRKIVTTTNFLLHCKYISEGYRYSIGILPIYQQIL